MSNPNPPPVQLVKTWLWMMLEAEEEMKKEGMRRIIQGFGSVKNAIDYVTLHEGH